MPSDPDNTAIQFTASALQRVTVPNGSDLNATAGPWAKKSIEFWFRANSVPAPGTTGLAATAGLWEEGAATRNIAVYLWRDPANSDPSQAQLVLNAVNNASDGAGAPYGPPGNPAVFALAPVQAGVLYHVVAVFDGDSAGTNGNLILFLNGVEVARGGGVGQIYNHTGDIRIGHGNGLIHTGQNGAFGYFDGVLDELTAYNRALSAVRVAAHYAAGAVNGEASAAELTVTDVDARGNPNQLLVTFSKRVASASANNTGNYGLQRADGLVIPIASASLLGGDRTVLLSGNFNFLVGSNYVLTVGNVTDQVSPPGALTPNPTNVAFTFAVPGAASYNFNDGSPGDLQFYGSAAVTSNGSYDGSGYLRLTDATNSQTGYVLFTERHDVDQFHLHFKARLSDTSVLPADGFSVNLAADLPTATFGTPEEGYLPLATLTNDRLIIAFDNFSNNSGDPSPFIAVKWRGVTLANVLTGTNGIPALHNNSGAWVDVDIRLKRGGKISVAYDGAIVISNLFTGFDVLPNAQLGLAARTGGSYETHWFDDISVSYNEGFIGPVGISPDSELANQTAGENQLVRFAVVPTGAGPFGYQWYFNGAPVPGGTARVLGFAATTNLVGQYHAVVWNDFSQATSPSATLAVDTDNVPPAVERTQGLAGSLNEIRIWFNEPVDALTATNIANYSTGALPLLSAAISSDGRLVILKTGPQTFQQPYTLQISGVKDRAATANVLNGPAQFTTTVSYPDEVLADTPVRYWRFNEANGANAFSLVSALDPLATTTATYVNSPALQQSPLVPNTFDDASVLLRATGSQRLTVPNGSDLNAVAGPWEKKSIEFWFRANSVPAPGTTGANAAAGLYEQGAGSRGLAIYLFRDPVNTNPAQSHLYFNAWNNVVADGLGSPYGVPATAKFVRTPVTTGVTYHVVAVFDGGTNVPTGQLVLYL
ncbi:MAG TPA: LamG-like jellyroll fold domain-containing protein, partial [Candidatus Limnocylindria bacterium]|nr:LamG-like jellyroll fold domain-containing protein [Candidatus Limnocylindria bacterium]